MSEEIRALYADDEGEIFDAPGFAGLGRTGRDNVPLTPAELIPLPDSADLMFLPDRLARCHAIAPRARRLAVRRGPAPSRRG